MRKLDVIGLHFGFFKDFGFEFNDTHLMFFKNFPQGKQVIFVQLSETPEGSFLEYNLGVRINKVEKLIHQFLPSLGDYSERSMTLIQPAYKLDKTLPKHFSIENDSELSQALIVAEKFFISKGFPWLDQMIDPVVLEHAFYNRKDKSFKSQNFVYNAFRATALSKLYNPLDYPEIRQNFLEQIQSREETPFTIASFLQFLNYLDRELPG
ncbi:hypothetical protein [Algoriphagus sp. CAU 1675]|uniref:hypothetical protein n=1 Tax=Algoriphagus sp. CAU 1675 TaxID=3032597 RepID=UPI0023DC769B|nr:hypothetical protein [Algoriphagus sp. CAU 1675]MDF2157969.1 hypothetical protein [Algoriphagus sp. CAU 1675]